MPLYEFRCESCGHTTETILAFSDPLPTTCESCGGALKKLLSAPAVQFKGSGFYATDSRAAKKAASSPAKSGAKTEPAKSEPVKAASAPKVEAKSA